MIPMDFDALWDKLTTGDESVEIEAKRAEEAGKSLWETVSAFANEPDNGGGYILLGIARKGNDPDADYEIVGVPKPDKVQADLATQCREAFNVPIRPDIIPHDVNGKKVLLVFIPEALAHDKPVYIASRGVNKGAYRRISSTDQLCTDDDLALFFQARGHRSFDGTAITDSSPADIDPRALAEYRRLRRESGGDPELLAYDDEDLLHALGALLRPEGGQPCLTLAGLLLFGTPLALRRLLPMTRVDYIRVDGREWVPDPDKRYQAVEKLGPLLLTVPALIAQVLEDIPKAFTLAEQEVHRRDVPLVPLKVIREAVVNALMHRDYRQHRPVQIIRYTNRVEIVNPGYSLKPEERFGEPGSAPRNPKLAGVLHDVNLAETKGTGIRAMREAMRRANLTLPLFESDRAGNTFTVRLLVHHLLDPADIDWLAQLKDCNLTDEEARALIVVRELGAIDNAAFRSMSGAETLTASRRLCRLRDVGLLEQKGRSTATYYVPTDKLKAAWASRRSVGSPPDKPLSTGLSPPDKPLSGGLNSPDKPLPTGFDPIEVARTLDLGVLPARLAEAIRGLGERDTSEELREVIRKLCAWRPLKSSQLAALLNRGQKHLRDHYLSEMVGTELEFLYPDSPAHPKQAYRAVKAARGRGG